MFESLTECCFDLNVSGAAHVAGANPDERPMIALDYSFSAVVLPYEFEVYSHRSALYFRIVDGDGKTVEDGTAADIASIGDPTAITRLVATASRCCDAWNAKLAANTKSVYV